jgi:aspartyl-tRNA(Asn)/glutamyl-tRNA(Gln) amidotransferase subunit A
VVSGQELSFASIAQLGAWLREGKTTAVELATLSLERLETVGRDLNAVVTVTSERALAEAAQADAELAGGQDRGPLHGIPYGAKDLLAVNGYPTTWGAAPLRNQQFLEDATVITLMREAGAVLTAKLAMVELAGGFGYDQPNAALTGPGLNAWHRGRWAGGSSSGSGSAVAAGCVPLAIGTETWGSIHVPAAFNGITGFRPTYGLVSRSGAILVDGQDRAHGAQRRRLRTDAHGVGRT